MRRGLFVLSIFLTFVCAGHVRATCTTMAKYTYVETQWWDGTTSGHWDFDGYYEVCSYGDSGGGSYTPPGPSGGGTSSPPPGVISLQQEYVDADCDVPPASAFQNETQYNANSAANYTFAELSNGHTYAIITEELKFGLDQMVNLLDGYVPRVTDAYRSPTDNEATGGSASCSAHTYGLAADISIRDESGNFSCTLWNMFAEAADGWIEPWTETVARGTPHFHVDFGRAKNDPGTCTGYP
jgi:hypothetical protein